jgi:hypothetical protein
MSTTWLQNGLSSVSTETGGYDIGLADVAAGIADGIFVLAQQVGTSAFRLFASQEFRQV